MVPPPLASHRFERTAAAVPIAHGRYDNRYCGRVQRMGGLRFATAEFSSQRLHTAHGLSKAAIGLILLVRAGGRDRRCDAKASTPQHAFFAKGRSQQCSIT
jgi:hypothetical protein